MTATIVAGLCSVTFRRLDVDEVIAVARDAGLAAIEWGADVHLPSGDLVTAERVRASCDAAGLACPSYGSYWFAGRSGTPELGQVLDTASALGATTIRVWAPGDPTTERWEDGRDVVDALRTACERAAERDLTIALEFHPNTLTETASSTTRLLAAVDRRNLRTYWQPRPGLVGQAAIDELEAVLDSLAHLHVFSWDTDSNRLLLSAHEALWRDALRAVADKTDGSRCAYLEFVANDDPVRLRVDAASLRSWLALDG
jgi:sugar phosphate isomerase/epimerase